MNLFHILSCMTQLSYTDHVVRHRLTSHYCYILLSSAFILHNLPIFIGPFIHGCGCAALPSRFHCMSPPRWEWRLHPPISLGFTRHVLPFTNITNIRGTMGSLILKLGPPHGMAHPLGGQVCGVTRTRCSIARRERLKKKINMCPYGTCELVIHQIPKLARVA